MKTVVSLQDLLELEIRPGDLLGEYHRLAELAVRSWPAAALHQVACPGCGSADARPAFERFGLAYRECGRCGSLYLSPRPSHAMLAEYARASEAAAFWRARVLPETEAARREKILQPRADWVGDAVAEHAPGAAVSLELRGLGEDDGLDDRPDGSADVVTAFEIFDRAPDPQDLLRRIHRVLKPGGLLFVTAPSASGFEIQVLWERARSIAPPDKINLLSIPGFMRLFSGAWEIVELSTPGMFDVETVRRAVAAEPDGPWPRFVRALVLETDDRSRHEFQEYLQRTRLASFARLLIRRL
jgi:SAM-dependent methyltransferase